MSAIPVLNKDGKAVGEVEIPAALLASKTASQALQQAIVTYRANQRAGTASTKTKGEVNGSGKKPWRQKGTGNARAGYRQSPVWRGGGVVFGPKPRSYRKDITRKTSKLALRRAIAARIENGGLVVVDDFRVEQPKTKAFSAALKPFGAERGALVVVDQAARELLLASRNIEGVELVEARQVNSLQLLKFPRVIVTKAALAGLQARLEEKAS